MGIENKSKLARFSDNMLFVFIIMIFLFLLINKFIKSLYIKLFITIFIGYITFLIINKLQNKKLVKLGIKKDEIKNIECLNISLRTQTYNEQISYIKKIFSSFKPKLLNKLILLENNVVIFNKLDESKLSLDSIFEIYSRVKKQNLKPTEIAIICNEIDQNTLNFKNKLNEFNISFITPDLLYCIAKKNNCEIKYDNNKIKSKKFKNIISNIFLKKQSKYFIRCGLLLFITSFMVPFSRYYIISASICLFVGLICLFFGNKEIKLPKSQLL